MTPTSDGPSSVPQWIVDAAENDRPFLKLGYVDAKVGDALKCQLPVAAREALEDALAVIRYGVDGGERR